MSEKAPLISVIVALYNAEAYLPACIDSVRACPEEAMECILVNDGSADKSRELCAEAVAADPRFMLIDKANTGVSDSRNAGLSAASGRYVFFLDADDYIDTEAWPEILAYACEAQADLVSFGYYSLFSSGRRQAELFAMPGDVSADERDTFAALTASPMLNTCWGKLMRRSVIEEHGLRFDTALVTCEDAVFVVDFAGHARRFVLCNRCVLFYRIHDKSAMRRRSAEDKLLDFSVLYDRRKNFLQVRDVPDLCPAMLRECFSVLTNLFVEYAADHRPSDIRAMFGRLLENPVSAEVLLGMDARGLAPDYKRLEYGWMRRGAVWPLSLYFKLKSRFLMR